MIEVYIAGVCKLSLLLQELLDTDKVEIKGYVSFERETAGQLVYGGYPLISIEQLQEKKFDYIIICGKNSFNKNDPRIKMRAFPRGSPRKQTFQKA